MNSLQNKWKLKWAVHCINSENNTELKTWINVIGRNWQTRTTLTNRSERQGIASSCVTSDTHHVSLVSYHHTYIQIWQALYRWWRLSDKSLWYWHNKNTFYRNSAYITNQLRMLFFITYFHLPAMISFLISWVMSSGLLLSHKVTVS